MFPELILAWTRTGSTAPDVSFGSSGNLYRQISQGAPFDLFLSADEEQVLKLIRTQRTDGDGAVYGVGRLVLLVPHHSRLSLDASLNDLGRAIGDGRLRRLAIANPAHAPYGRAAQEALVRTALWPQLEDRLLLAENAAQAVQFALTAAPTAGSCPTRSPSPIGSRTRPVMCSSPRRCSSHHAPDGAAPALRCTGTRAVPIPCGTGGGEYLRTIRNFRRGDARRVNVANAPSHRNASEAAVRFPDGAARSASRGFSTPPAVTT